MPDIDVNDSEGGGDGPGVDEFAAVAGGGVGSYAVGAAFDPLFDVVAHFVPEETEADAVERFVCHEVTGGGTRVENFEYATA